MPSIFITLSRVWRISPKRTKRGLSQADRSSSFADRAFSRLLSVSLGKTKRRNCVKQAFLQIHYTAII